MTETPYRGRFAPSPTGPLHFGSLVAALASYADARANDGLWLLRIDDVDQTRTRPGARAAILSTLERFGFEWDGDIVCQSEREPRYLQVLAQLESDGFVYPCTCTRREIAAIGRKGCDGPVYPGTCRNGPTRPGRPAALRARTDDRTVIIDDRIHGALEQDIARDVGDFVVRRADGYTAYQLAVVIDDADQRISHVVRGADLLWSTPRQRYLQDLLNLSPPSYAHIPLVRDSAGKKLSKRHAAFPVEEERPLRTLMSAWQFLGQSFSRRPASLGEFWPAAFSHWDINRIRR